MIDWIRQIIRERQIRDAEVDVNAKCPACGHRVPHKLRCIVVDAEQKPNKTVMVEHTCAICEAKFFAPTVMDPKNWVSKDLLGGAPLDNQPNL